MLDVLKKNGRIVAGFLALTILVSAPLPAAAFLWPHDRQELDLSKFVVTDPNASYFDVAARMALLDRMEDPQLREVDNQIESAFSCRSFLSAPVIRENIALPSFYDSPEDWRIATEANFAFEDAVSKLAGGWIASGDKYYATCLIDYLEKWAEADALESFHFTPQKPQAWYAIESMIFAAALAYSTVRGEDFVPAKKKQKVEKWLVEIAEAHLATKGGRPSCCNNHFYRRALYMTAVGVVTDTDKLFQRGLSALFSAAHDIQEDGALGLAMTRGRRAIHYQNYSLQYLTMIMQLAYRQGYDFYRMELYGHRFSEAVEFLLDAMENPGLVSKYARPEQNLSFTEDPQYVSWMEVWLIHFYNPRMESFVKPHRPIYNRSAGGYMTFYFKRPETIWESAARQIDSYENDHLTPAEIGGRYPKLDLWRRSQ